MKIKILVYNISRGFYDKSAKIHEVQREKNAIKIVKKENPDILFLLEAYFFKGNNFAKRKFKIVQDYQKLFGYKFQYAGFSKNKKGGILALSRFPLKYKNFSKPQRNWLRVFLDNKIKIDVLHPSGELKEVERYNFVKKVLGKVGKRKYILAGDLNSLSPQDDYSKKRLLSGFKKFDNNYKKTVEDFLKKQTIKVVLSKGLVDSYKQKKDCFDFTMPTGLISKNKQTAMRIDYIFCSKDFKIIDAGIIKNKFSDFASDHYPIFAVLEIPDDKK